MITSLTGPANILTERVKEPENHTGTIVSFNYGTTGPVMNRAGICPKDRPEGAMARFRDIKAPQKFASVHPSIHNHFNLDRQITDRDDLKQTPLPPLPSGVSSRPEGCFSGHSQSSSC